MARGGINHLALTASDPIRSAEFYDKILGFMGYRREQVPEATQQAMQTGLDAWVGPAGAVTLRPARGEARLKVHDRNAPGLNHVAFDAQSRADVDQLHELLRTVGVQILDPPAEYPYFPGYYAVYFTDPDGIKIEFVFWPQG